MICIEETEAYRDTVRRLSAAREKRLAELAAGLFFVQCRVLDLGTSDKMSADQLRDALMELRKEIINIREKR